MLYFLLTLLVGFLGVVYLFPSRVERPGKRLPGPTGLPILGCLLDFTPDQVLENLKKYADTYGPSFELVTLGQRMVVVADPEVVRDVLVKRPKAFRRAESIEYPARVAGFDKGVFVAEGEDWGRARRLTAPAFSHANLAALVGTISDCGVHWLQKIKEFAAADGTITSEGMTLFELFTTTVLVRAAFGDEVEGTYLETPQFFKDMSTILQYLTDRVLWPLPEWTWRLLPLPVKIHVRLANNRLTRTAMELILKAREHAKTEGEGAQGNEGLFIKSLMRARDSNADGNARDALSNDDLLAQIKTFIIAGSETTSTVLTWTLKELAASPELCARIREEVAGLLEKTGGKWPQTMLDLQELKWCEATFREAVRMYSPAPNLFFSPLAPTELSNGVFVLPTDLVVLRTEHFQREDATLFKDPMAFRPERWLDNPTKEMLDVAQLTFGGGPRICPGMRLAYCEGMLALGMLVHHYDVQLQCDPKEVVRVFQFTSKSTKMPVKLVPRTL